MAKKTPKPFEPRKPVPKPVRPELSTDRKSMADRQEQRLSKELKFKQTKGSGNQPWPSQKGDGQDHEFVFEAKRDKGSGITVGPGVIGKLVREARTLDKHPVLLLTIDAMPAPLPKDWVVIEASLFRSLFPEKTDGER